MQQWDGAKWVKVSDWIAPMKDKVVPLLDSGRAGLRRPRTSRGRSAPRLATSRRNAERTIPLSPPPFGGERSVVWSAHVRRRATRTDTTASAAGGQHPFGQQHRGDLRPRHPGAQGRVARRAEGRHRGAARRQRRRQDHHAEGDLQPAARRARRRHQGHDHVRGRRGAGRCRPTNWCGAAASR